MRLRSPAKIASILIVACALCLAGVALAAGGSTKRLGPHFGGAAIDQQRALVQRPRARAQRHATLARHHRDHRAGPPLANAKPVRRAPRRALATGVAVGTSHNVGETVAAVAEPQSPQASPQVTPSSPSSPVPPGAPPNMPTPTPPGESAAPALYWGASIGSQLTGVQAPWDMGAVTRFEQIAGKQVSLVNFFAPFANCASTPCSFYPFPTGPMERIRTYGAIPVFSWSSQSIPSNRVEPDFQLSDVIEGRYDTYIREFAEDARDWGHPFFLRFNWEMNGTWFPWSEGVNGNQPGEFVAAWRHVHDISAPSVPITRPGSGAPTSIPTRSSTTSARCIPATPTSTGPASTATTGGSTRPSRIAGAASTSSSARPTAGSPIWSHRASRC